MNRDVRNVIDSEVNYAKDKWETKPRSERPLRDSEKPVEFWLTQIDRYYRKAVDGCAGTNKRPALVAIRKIAALCVRCMENNDTPKRVTEREPKAKTYNASRYRVGVTKHRYECPRCDNELPFAIGHGDEIKCHFCNIHYSLHGNALEVLPRFPF